MPRVCGAGAQLALLLTLPLWLSCSGLQINKDNLTFVYHWISRNRMCLVYLAKIKMDTDTQRRSKAALQRYTCKWTAAPVGSVYAAQPSLFIYLWPATVIFEISNPKNPWVTNQVNPIILAFKMFVWHITFCQPYWIRHFEFLQTKVIFVISDPKNFRVTNFRRIQLI